MSEQINNNPSTEYPRTTADELAELKSDEAWQKYGVPGSDEVIETPHVAGLSGPGKPSGIYPRTAGDETAEQNVAKAVDRLDFADSVMDDISKL